jgi:hypothetical protein
MTTVAKRCSESLEKIVYTLHPNRKSEMPTSDAYNQEQKRDFYRELAAKQHLAIRMARTGRVSACDATETETAEDYCKRMLEQLGLKASKDPIADLTLFLAGHDSAALSSVAGRSAMDSSSGNPSLDKYLAS